MGCGQSTQNAPARRVIYLKPQANAQGRRSTAKTMVAVSTSGGKPSIQVLNAPQARAARTSVQSRRTVKSRRTVDAPRRSLRPSLVESSSSDTDSSSSSSCAPIRTKTELVPRHESKFVKKNSKPVRMPSRSTRSRSNSHKDSYTKRTRSRTRSSECPERRVRHESRGSGEIVMARPVVMPVVCAVEPEQTHVPQPAWKSNDRKEYENKHGAGTWDERSSSDFGEDSDAAADERPFLCSAPVSNASRAMSNLSGATGFSKYSNRQPAMNQFDSGVDSVLTAQQSNFLADINEGDAQMSMFSGVSGFSNQPGSQLSGATFATRGGNRSRMTLRSVCEDTAMS